MAPNSSVIPTTPFFLFLHRVRKYVCVCMCMKYFQNEIPRNSYSVHLKNIKSVTLTKSRNGKICLASLGGCSIVYDGMIIPLSMTHGHQRPAGPRFRVIPPLIWHRTHSRSCLNERSKFKYEIQRHIIPNSNRSNTD